MIKDLTDRFKKLEDLEPLIKISRFIGSFFRKSSNDTQENSKDAQKKRKRLKELRKKSTN